MKKPFLILLGSTLAAGSLTAQNREIKEETEEVKTVRKIGVRDFYINTGLMSQLDQYGSLSDFKILAPQSGLLNSNFATYNSGGGIGISSNSILSIMIGINLRDKDKTKYKTNAQLRMGVSYFSGAGLSYNIFQTIRKPYDTLVSTQTGQTTYVDSVYTKNYNMSYSSQQLRFDCSLLFKTDTKARWSFFSGIGFNAGMALNARTFINYYESRNTEENGKTNSYYSQNSNYFKTETYSNKSNWGVSAYVPMGVDFRIGRKREFWKRTHLFYEFRPGINVVSIPELRTITTPGVQHGFGLRVSLD